MPPESERRSHTIELSAEIDKLHRRGYPDLTMHPLAEALNHILSGVPSGALLSQQAQKLYFPKGIVAQAQEAAQSLLRFNATAGLAREEDAPLMLPSLQALLPGLSPAECVDYAPTGGDPALRRLWRKLLIEKNPGLSSVAFSLPLVTAGVTHGLSLTADLFIDQGDLVLCNEPAWENYELIFKAKKDAAFASFPFFGRNDGFNLKEIESRLEKNPGTGKTVLILNFPHNPTGYSLTEKEADDLVSILLAAAQRGKRLIVIIDDAYFGLFYENGLRRESLFSRLAAIHENLLAVKLDGATKEDFVWGFRIGFLTLGALGLEPPHYEAFEQKCLAAIRTSVSSASRPAQSLLVRLLDQSAYRAEKERAFEKLKARYRAAKDFLARSASPFLRPLPFNSGYFLSFRTSGVDAPALRERLLREKGVGVIALGRDLVRVSFASVDEADLPELFGLLFEAAAALGEKPRIHTNRHE